MENNITTRFEDFKNKEVDKFNKTKEYKPLSDDITFLSKLDNGEYTPIKGEVNIIQVLGLVDNQSDIDNIEKSIKENFTMDTSLVVKDIKRGDILYLTALLQKTNSFNSQSIGVVKVRVVDFYKGVSKLNNIKK